MSTMQKMLSYLSSSTCTQCWGAVVGSLGINGLHWPLCREVIRTFLGSIGFLQHLSQTDPVLLLCSRELI